MASPAVIRTLKVNQVTGAIMTAAMKVHFELGPGLELGYRIDPLVEDLVVVEIKCVEAINPVHEAQLLSYIRLSGENVGLLINFHVAHLRDGIKRMVDGKNWEK